MAGVHAHTESACANLSPFVEVLASRRLFEYLQVLDLKWSGREDLNLRPPGPELWKYKVQLLYLVSLREQRTSFSLAQLYRSCTEQSEGCRVDSGVTWNQKELLF